MGQVGNSDDSISLLRETGNELVNWGGEGRGGEETGEERRGEEGKNGEGRRGFCGEDQNLRGEGWFWS